MSNIYNKKFIIKNSFYLIAELFNLDKMYGLIYGNNKRI